MKRICAACGRLAETQAIGKAQVCMDCAGPVKAEIEALRKTSRWPVINAVHAAKRLLSRRPLVKGKLFRDFPGDLAELLADRAAKSGMTEREIILSALWEYLT